MRSHTAISSDRDARRRTAWGLLAGFLAGGIVAAFAVTASGQQPEYEVKELDPRLKDERMVKRMQTALRRYATTRDPDGFDERNYALGYVRIYVPARITDPEAAGEISELTSALVNSLKTAQRANYPAQSTLAPGIYGAMKEVAEGNYHPPARIGATLVLAQLDMGSSGANQPPKISSQIVNDLLQLYSDEGNDDGVRAAALQGVHRQVSFGFDQLSDEVSQGIVAEMTELLDSPTPTHRSPEAHAYLQRFAVDLLGLLRGTDDQDLATKLVSISTASDSPDLIAFHSAARIAGMQEALTGNVDAPALVLDKWSARVLRVFESELTRLQSFDPPKSDNDQPPAPREVLRPSTERRSTGRGDGDYTGASEEMEDMGDLGDYGGEMMDEALDDYMPGSRGEPEVKPQPPEVLASRRHLNLIMQQVHLAATGSAKAGVPSQPGGLLAAVEEADQPLIRNWIAQMESVVTSMNDEVLEDREKFIEAIEDQLAILEALAGDQLEEAEPEVDADVEPAELPVTAVAPPEASP